MKYLMLKFIYWYQKADIFKSPIAQMFFIPKSPCKFNPCCSEYMSQAIIRFGFVKGTYLGIKRIIKCNPLSKGGSDPIPEK